MCATEKYGRMVRIIGLNDYFAHSIPAAGAASDLRKATTLARQLITDWGMSEKLGVRTFGDKEEMVFLGRAITEQRDYSENTAQAIDQEISRFLQSAYERAETLLKGNLDKIEKVVAVLIKQETIEAEEFKQIMA